jgi:hypothetical protein
MKTILTAFFALCPFAAFGADYKADWSIAAFYQNVNACRASVTARAIEAYLGRGREDKVPEENLRKDVISLLPALESPSSAMCFCLVNEMAKSTDYAEYNGRLPMLDEKMPQCATMAKVPDRSAIEALRLR